MTSRSRKKSRTLQAGRGNGVREVQALDGAKICFQDGSWLLLRPSGTEPLLRIYTEAKTPAQMRILLQVGRLVAKQVVGN